MVFNKTVNDLALIYVMMQDVRTKEADEVVKDVKLELENHPTVKFIVIDFKKFYLDHKAFKIFTPLGLELRKRGQQICVLSEDIEVYSLIQQEALTQILQPISSLSEIGIGTQKKKSPPKLDVSFINPFIDATIHVLEVQCGTQAKPQKPVLKAGSSFRCQTDIAGIIGITSKSFHGSIAICFPAQVFLDLMSKMLGEECKEINDEIKDGAAEITNMIFGQAKKVLNENGHTIEKALPSVVRATDLKVDHAGSQDSIILPFLVGEAMFFMEIGTESVGPGTSRKE